MSKLFSIKIKRMCLLRTSPNYKSCLYMYKQFYLNIKYQCMRKSKSIDQQFLCMLVSTSLKPTFKSLHLSGRIFYIRLKLMFSM